MDRYGSRRSAVQVSHKEAAQGQPEVIIISGHCASRICLIECSGLFKWKVTRGPGFASLIRACTKTITSRAGSLCAAALHGVATSLIDDHELIISVASLLCCCNVVEQEQLL